MKNFIVTLFIVLLVVTGCNKKNDDKQSGIDKLIETTNKTKKNIAEELAYAVRSSAKIYYSVALLEGTITDDIVFTCTSDGCVSDSKILELSTPPSSGTITIKEDGVIEFDDIIINGYRCHIPDIGAISCS